MLYLLVDPHFFYFDRSDQAAVKNFVERLNVWGGVARVYDVSFGLTSDCVEALRSALKTALELDDLGEIVVTAGKSVDFAQLCYPFVSRVMNGPYIDQILVHLVSDNWLWDIEEVYIVPEDYLVRLQSSFLSDPYRDMMGRVTFARKQGVIPLSEFHHVAVLSTFDEGTRWAQEAEYKMYTRIRCVCVMDSAEEGADDKLPKDVTEIYDVIQSPEYVLTHTEKLAERQFRSLEEALQAATTEYPNVLHCSSKAYKTAQNFGDMGMARTLYELLIGLVEVWLPAYCQHGQDAANDAFYNEFQYECASHESHSVQQDMTLRQEYEVLYDGKPVFCQRHVKVGVGPFALRINFQIVEQEGKTPIIVIGRAGKHGPNAGHPT